MVLMGAELCGAGEAAGVNGYEEPLGRVEKRCGGACMAQVMGIKVEFGISCFPVKL